MKRTALLLGFLALAGAAHGAERTPFQQVLLSATRVFQFDNHLVSLPFSVGPDEDNENHIGDKFAVSHAVTNDAIEDCRFTMRRRDGTLVQTIDFEKLSSEVSIIPMRGPYVTLQVAGLPGASCEVNGDGQVCKAGLSMLLYTGSQEHVTVMRALRYIAASGCTPAVLPPR